MARFVNMAEVPDHCSFHVMARFVNMAEVPDHSGFQWVGEAGGDVRRCKPKIEGERFPPDRGLR